MPFKSAAQREWMYAHHPEMAKRWEAETPPGKLPRHVNADLAVADVHQPAALGPRKVRSMSSISAAKRKGLPLDKFAIPRLRKYPIDTPERVRAAEDYLEKEHNAGKVSSADYGPARRRIARAAKRFGIESKYNKGSNGGKTLHVRADLADGGSLHVRHMNDRVNDVLAALLLRDLDVAEAMFARVAQVGAAPSGVVALRDDGAGLFRDWRPIKQGSKVDPRTAGVRLMGPDKWSDGSLVELVWVQLAEVGEWKGHASGPFRLTTDTFAQMRENFDKRGLPVPFDFEHASEQDPTQGSIPINGAPAQAWIHRLDNRGSDGLWGLVEWLDRAREGIRKGEYGFLSPAIRFNTKDPVTGGPAGARLTSAAITNQPFLTHIGSLVAASDRAVDGGDQLLVVAGGVLAHKPHEYMPQVRHALSLHPLATAAEAAEHLDKLRDHFDAVGQDPDASHEGVKLGEYMMSLRSLVGASPGDTWDDVLDTVADMIDAAADHDGPGTDLDDADAGDDSSAMNDQRADVLLRLVGVQPETTMSDIESKIALAEQKLGTLTTQLSDAQTKTATLELKLTETSKKLSDAESELVTLRAWKTERETADLAARVDEAFETYKDKKGLTDKNKPALLTLLKADAAGFEELYPRVSADKRHLLRNVTPPDPTKPTVASDEPVEANAANVRALAFKVSIERGISIAEAQDVVLASLKAPTR